MLIDSSKVLVKLGGGFSPQGVFSSIARIVAVVEDENVIDGFIVCSLSTREGYNSFLDSLSDINGVRLVEPYYLKENGIPLMVGEGICVAFHETVSYGQIDSINALYNVVIERQRIGRDKSFTLKNTDSSGYRVVDLANAYHNLPEVEYSHPNFSANIVSFSYKLYDYHHLYQPHTKRVIGAFNSASVWDFAGLTQGITVAVLDRGVESHEDLPASRILPGYDVAGGPANDYQHDNDPSPFSIFSHGMSVAGIIGASHSTDSAEGNATSSGIISLDPHVNILPVKIFTDDGSGINLTVDDLADAFDFAWTQGADVIANSWGYVDPDEPNYPVLDQAIQSATVFGRGGLGCPVIFASGNLTQFYSDRWEIRYPARLPYVFAVGAIRLLDDEIWIESCFGPEQDMVAYSYFPNPDGIAGVWSLDRMGNFGINPFAVDGCPHPLVNDRNYDCEFGGTSAACPVVAGTAALIMSKNSTFNFEGYYFILRQSAVTELSWGPIPDPPHDEYGYGLVDAFRAALSISRGDLNNDNAIGNTLDLTFMVDMIFRGGPDPFPSALMGDCNCDGTPNNVIDLTYLIDYIHRGGPPPINPCFEF